MINFIIFLHCRISLALFRLRKKLLNSDWLRAVQFKCNTASAKSVTPVQLQVQKNYAKMIAKKKKLQKMMLIFIIINK